VPDIEISPTARALLALDLMQRTPGITAGQLAERLGVTDRAARRYVAILREADIPVISEPGRYGGYRIGHGLRLPPMVFTAAEALGLVMAVLDGQHAAADPADLVGAALGKLIRALPDAVAAPARAMREHALAVPRRGTVRPDPEITSTLVAAVAGRRRARVGYRSGSGNRFRTDVDPWAVVVRYGLWYLLCLTHPAGEVRTFRIDRVESVEMLSQPFQPPEDLDPVGWLERHLGTGWAFRTEVTFDAPYAEVAPYVSATMGQLTPVDSGASCVLVGSTRNPAMYAGERLAGIPFPFRVQGGPELRVAVAALARRLAAATEAATEECRVPQPAP
jgi:predicted DNA-binding transcriptional regulator YafY